MHEQDFPQDEASWSSKIKNYYASLEFSLKRPRDLMNKSFKKYHADAAGHIAPVLIRLAKGEISCPDIPCAVHNLPRIGYKMLMECMQEEGLKAPHFHRGFDIPLAYLQCCCLCAKVPCLSALVVNKKSNYTSSGSGFYEWYRKIREEVSLPVSNEINDPCITQFNQFACLVWDD